jgi:hypothetical protein
MPPALWEAVHETLARQDVGSPVLDPLGGNGGPRDARALPQMALALLAWAKNQQADVVSYGLADRLHFLWQWGKGQRLGRLTLLV